MKTFTKSLSGLLTASALAIGLSVVAQSAVAGIVGSKHDLSATGPSGDAAGPNEICVFCHTPHGANTNVSAPLWNKALPAVTYDLYNSPTMDGTTAAGSVSLACLSCHDGTQARDNMINAPGSGGYNALGANFTGDPGTYGVIVGADDTVPNLGTNLANDHPIGMNYCGATDAAAAVAGTCADDSFFFKATTNGTRVWVEVDGGLTFQKTDFPLYVNGGSDASVECATCHDPHRGDEAGQALFLRSGTNDGSQVCLTCHDK